MAMFVRCSSAGASVSKIWGPASELKSVWSQNLSTLVGLTSDGLKVGSFL